MSMTSNRQNCANGITESNKAGIGKLVKKAINQIKSNAAKFFIVVWVGLLALWSEPFLADYYQKQANSHYDIVQWVQMGPVFLVALILSIYSFVKKRYFVGVLTGIMAIWAFYWAFMVSFSCFHCTYGG